MSNMDRRDAIKAGAGFALTTATVVLSPISVFAQGKENTATKFQIGDLTPKELPFDPKKLHGLSEKLITSHWENNYSGSIKTLNAINKKLSAALADKEFPAFIYNGIKREHLLRTGSVVLHELYFDNLGGNGKSGGESEKAIKLAFGDMNTWETEFRRIAQGLAGGSGWVILGYNFHQNRLENYWSSDHMHSPVSTVPILVMDMYEHSYQMDYGAAAAKYTDAFFKNIQWEAVESRFSKAKKFIGS